MTVEELLAALEDLAPAALAEEWDNVGLMVGRPESESSSVLLALDLRDAVLAEAREGGHGIVLTHHPLIFPEIASVTPASAPGRLALAAIEAGIALVAAHTNLDAARGGLNDLMAEALGLDDSRPLVASEGDPSVGLGRIGALPAPTTLAELTARAELLWPSGAGHTGDPARRVARIAVCTGSGGGLIDAARDAGADAYVTCDLKYHDADRAEGMALIGLDHAAVEAALLAQWAPRLADRLARLGASVVVADADTSPWSASAPR